MRLLAVLDIKNGLVVRGIAGRREQYRPVVSNITSSAQPLEVARAFRRHFDLTELYVADLDAIACRPPAVDIYAALQADGFRLWVDCGVRDGPEAQVLAADGVERIVAGLETLTGPAALRRLCEEHGDRIVFSLDLKGGKPLPGSGEWNAAEASAIAGQAVACGVRRLIVLDLARVGLAEGTGTEELCGRLITEYPEVQVLAGGGVRGPADLLRLRRSGVAGALVASALHDGRLTREDLKEPSNHV
jgi:phosphoribosylformimino-5-aminoimidazole carboxamide ribotide isomerase